MRFKITKKKIIIVVILLILVGVCDLYVRKRSDSDGEITTVEVIDGIQGYYGMAKYFNMVELGNGKVDTEFYKEVKSDYEDFIDDISYKNAGFLELIRVIYTNDIFGVENKNYLKELENYYDYSNDLFISYNISSLIEPEKYIKEYVDDSINNTMIIYNMMNKSRVNIDRYDIKKGLIKQYNKSENRDLKVSMIYTFYEMGCLNEIDCSDVLNSFENIYQSELKKVKNDSYKLDNTDAGTYNFLYVCDAMGINITDYKNAIKKKMIDINSSGFNLIDNEEVSSSVLMSSAYWWDVVNKSPIIEWNDEFWYKLESLYRNYYNMSLKKKIQEYSE